LESAGSVDSSVSRSGTRSGVRLIPPEGDRGQLESATSGNGRVTRM